jgi:hypothetical protein
MSTFNTPYWPEDYFNQFFRPSGGGGAIVGALAGSAAGVATATGTLEDAAVAVTTRSGVVRLAGSLVYEQDDRRVSMAGLMAVLAVAQRASVSAGVVEAVGAPAPTQEMTREAAVAELVRLEAAISAHQRAAKRPANDDDEAIALLLAA